MISVLHNIRSAYNVGSIFRTADGAGVRKLYLCGITPAPLDAFGKPCEKITKVSLGAEKTVAWKRVARTADCIRRLKQEGYYICALELVKDALPYTTKGILDAHGTRIAIIIGNEVRGVPKAIRARCDATIYIPMRGKKESLNAAVAFGIIAFEAAKYESIEIPPII